MHKVILLSHDVSAGSDIKPCNKIDKSLVVYRLPCNIMTSNIMLRKRWQKSWCFHAKNVILNKILFHVIKRTYYVCSSIIEFIKFVEKKAIKCLARLAFYRFSSTRLINSIKNWHSCKILYIYDAQLTPVRFLDVKWIPYMHQSFNHSPHPSSPWAGRRMAGQRYRIFTYV